MTTELNLNPLKDAVIIKIKLYQGRNITFSVKGGLSIDDVTIAMKRIEVR